MKKNNIFGIAVAAIAIISGVSLVESYKTNKRLEKFEESMDKISDKIDIDIPEKLVTKAVNDAAYKAAKKAADEAANKVLDDIHKEVSRQVNAAVDDIKPQIQKELENELSMLDISDIKKEAASKAAKLIVKDVAVPRIFNDGSAIVKSCTEAGMNSWDIERILKAVMK